MKRLIMNSNLAITEASNNKEREILQKFFEERIPNVTMDAIQHTELDFASESYILQVHDSDAKLVGAISSALTMPVFANRAFGIPLSPKHLVSSSKVREIDLIAVDKNYRNQGIASELLVRVENDARSRNCSILCGGGVAKDDEMELLVKFYEKNEYSICDELPPFFGFNWLDPYSVSHFYFYKRL